MTGPGEPSASALGRWRRRAADEVAGAAPRRLGRVRVGLLVVGLVAGTVGFSMAGQRYAGRHEVIAELSPDLPGIAGSSQTTTTETAPAVAVTARDGDPVRVGVSLATVDGRWSSPTGVDLVLSQPVAARIRLAAPRTDTWPDELTSKGVESRVFAAALQVRGTPGTRLQGSVRGTVLYPQSYFFTKYVDRTVQLDVPVTVLVTAAESDARRVQVAGAWLATGCGLLLLGVSIARLRAAARGRAPRPSSALGSGRTGEALGGPLVVATAVAALGLYLTYRNTPWAWPLAPRSAGTAVAVPGTEVLRTVIPAGLLAGLALVVGALAARLAARSRPRPLDGGPHAR